RNHRIDEKPLRFAFGRAHVDEQAGEVVLHRQVFRNFRNDDRANGARIGVRLDHHGRPLFAALAGGVREANENHVTPFHGFSGRSSYSSQSSCLTLSQATACSSSLVQGLSSYSSLRRS